jgi:hypothetical protein
VGVFGSKPAVDPFSITVQLLNMYSVTPMMVLIYLSLFLTR